VRDATTVLSELESRGLLPGYGRVVLLKALKANNVRGGKGNPSLYRESSMEHASAWQTLGKVRERLLFSRRARKEHNVDLAEASYPRERDYANSRDRILAIRKTHSKIQFLGRRLSDGSSTTKNDCVAPWYY